MGVTCTAVATGVDTTSPTLTSFSLSTASIDTTGAPATVQASFTVADDLSGIVFVAVFLQSPSLNQSRSCFWSAPQPYPLMATNGCSLAFPQFGEAERGWCRMSSSRRRRK